MGLAHEVAIVGVGMTRFGENFEQSYFDMVVEAGYAAMQDAGVEPREIEAAWLGTAYAYDYTTEGNAGTSLAEPLGLYGIPITRVANYCATGTDAIRNAALAVAAGEYDVVLVVGAEKMRDVPPRGSLVQTHVSRGHPLYCKGRTAPGMFALVATRYGAAYGLNIKDYMADVAVKNHYHGSLNPLAHFRKPVTKEQVLKAPAIADPIGLFDACPTTDGSAAVVLMRREVARARGKSYSVIRGIGLSVDSGYFSAQMDQTFDYLGFKATQHAAEKAYKQAGISNPPEEIDVIELHDCFTITEIVNYEDLFLCERGQGWRLAAEGVTRRDGKLPVNTSGGLKSCGHPIGASGVRMVANIHDQLLGRAGKMQIENPKVGVAHNLGGPGAVGCVVVLGREQ
ncbi:MAG: acetyl-CoA acetyltransferase [Chloroflexi bacterium]|nr:acetyl-CoA acetyltransferase [Chloroflexota bacterium]